MADVKFSDLAELTTLATNDLIAATDTSESGAEKSKKVQLSTLRDWLIITGHYNRPSFVYKDADEIYVNPGFYDVDGKYATWASQLTVKLSDADASTWYYLYLDYSGITSGTALTASEFLFSTTAPSWSNAKLGYYNGSDRCCFAVLTNGSSNIREFNHDGGNYVGYVSRFTDRTEANLTTTFTDVTLTAPGFCGAVEVLISNRDANNGLVNTLYRKNGSSESTGLQIINGVGGDVEAWYSGKLFTDTSQIIELKHNTGTNRKCAVYSVGWYFPEYM